jgi:4-hydroxy-tetrahydrodipicolinate reductase
MGQAIREALPAEAGVRIAAALVRKDSPLLGQAYLDVTYSSDLDAGLAAADVLLDFSVPASTRTALDACTRAGKSMVIGVTGLDAAAKDKIQTAGKRIPVLVAPNMSLGVALLTQLATAAARALGEEFDIEITEAHHRHKRDAPSGTALALAEAMAGARGQPLEPRPAGLRPAGSIGFAVVRAGDIVGEHTVLFAGKGERLELSHRAGSRVGFARGALKAAAWLRQQPAGVYALTDMLRSVK